VRSPGRGQVSAFVLDLGRFQGGFWAAERPLLQLKTTATHSADSSCLCLRGRQLQNWVHDSQNSFLSLCGSDPCSSLTLPGSRAIWPLYRHLRNLAL